MKKIQRQEKICDLLQQNGELQVKELCEIFKVSDMTIRRDLNELTKAKRIQRTFGGATINAAPQNEIAYTTSLNETNKSKTRIALKAIEFIKPSQIVYIDSGTTTSPIVQSIPGNYKISVVTRNLRIIQKISENPNITTIVIGGFLRNTTLSCYGTQTEDQIKQYKYDIAFLGSTAVGDDGFFYDGNPLEADIKKCILSSSKKTYVLVDSTKCGKYGLVAFGHVRDVTGIITDSKIDPEMYNRYIEMGAKIIVVD